MLLQGLMILNQVANAGILTACAVIAAPFELIDKISKDKEKKDLEKKLSADKNGFISHTILSVDNSFGIIRCIAQGEEETNNFYLKKSLIGSSWALQNGERKSIATIKKASKSGSSILYFGDTRISWIFPKSESKYDLHVGKFSFEINQYAHNRTITVGTESEIKMKITETYGGKDEFLIECKEEADELLGLFIIVSLGKL